MSFCLGHWFNFGTSIGYIAYLKTAVESILIIRLVVHNIWGMYIEYRTTVIRVMDKQNIKPLSTHHSIFDIR